MGQRGDGWKGTTQHRAVAIGAAQLLCIEDYTDGQGPIGEVWDDSRGLTSRFAMAAQVCEDMSRRTIPAQLYCDTATHTRVHHM